MINTDRLVSLFMDLVRIDSPSLGEKQLADHIYKLLEPKGYELHFDQAGSRIGGNCDNLIVRIPATRPGQPIAFAAHMDCVPPCLGVEPVLKNGVIRSAGQTVLGSDDKAGIAAILEALFSLEAAQLPHPELELIFTVCEEQGLVGAKAMDFSLLRAKDVVVLDASGPVGTIIVRSPSKAAMHIVFHGQAAHAGMNPEKGISAIQMAAQAITQMRLLRVNDDVVANLGRIEGGEQTNVVADKVTLTAETRAHSSASLQTQIDHMRQCCERAAQDFGGQVEFSSEIAYPALAIDPESDLVRRTQQSCKNLGLKVHIAETGGGSDANIFAAQGLNCINLGIDMSNVHSIDEFITVDSLEQTARLVHELMQEDAALGYDKTI